MSALSTLRTEQCGRVLTVSVDHPPRNLLDQQVGEDLQRLVRELERDSTIRSVVITGHPPETFMTRYETREMLRDTAIFFRPITLRQAQTVLALTRTLRRLPALEHLLMRTPLRGAVTLHRFNATFRAIGRMDKTFVAAINGMAVGGGFLIPLACDLRVVADDAGPIGLPEPALGIVPAMGGTQRAVRAIGTARALNLMLRGSHLSPVEALELGLIDEVVPRADLLPTAQERAERLASHPPQLVGYVKRLIYEGGSRSLDSGTHLEEAAAIAGLSLPTSKAAVEAFTARLNHPGESDADQVKAYELAL